MAGFERTAKLIFSGDDQVSRVMVGIAGHLDDIENRTKQMNTSVRDITSPFASMAEGVLKVDAALTALAVGGLAYAFKASTALKTATLELLMVVGYEIDQLDVAKQNAISLSDAYGESATSVLDSTANFRQAGFTVSDSMQLAKDAMDLVIAGSVDASSASEILIAALKGFKAPASEASHLIDILNEVSNNYATDVEQLAVGMSKLSPIAETMGFSMEETAGVLTPIIEIFRSGNEAATALKTGLLKLVDDAKPVRDALDSIGVSQHDANGNLRSGKDILEDVSNAFKGLDDSQKLFVAQQLVGIEQAGRMVTVFDNLAKTSILPAAQLKRLLQGWNHPRLLSQGLCLVSKTLGS